MVPLKSRMVLSEAHILELIDRIRILFDKALYGPLNPKFNKLKELYENMLEYAGPEAVSNLEEEIKRLEGE